MKGLALLLLALCVGACAASTTVYVPRTPEGNACMRDCMRMHNECAVSCWGYQGWSRMGCTIGCDDQETSCWRTCPGAYER